MVPRIGAVLRAYASLGRRGIRAKGRTKFEGGSPQLDLRGNVVLGEAIRLRSRQVPVQISVGENATLRIGNRVTLNQGVNIWTESSITIGDDCLIGDMVTIHDTAAHQIEPQSTTKVAPIQIGKNVWIGRGAMIFPGVCIGDHAVIGAGSIVTRAVEDATLVAGNPATVKRKFDVPLGSWIRT